MHFGSDVADGADVCQGVQRHSDIEVIFQLSDELQHLQGIQTKVRQQFARCGRLDRPSADALQDVDDVEFYGLGGR